MIKKQACIWLVIVLSWTIIMPQPTSAEQNTQDAMIYSLMIDRFNNGNTENDGVVDRKDPLAHHGGDFQGIINKLDYLQNELSFTEIQLSSIFLHDESDFTGELVKDYRQIDPRFGTLDEFKKLLNEVHKRGMTLSIEFPIQGNQSQEDFIDVVNWWSSNTDIDGLKFTHIKRIDPSEWAHLYNKVKEANHQLVLSASDPNTTTEDKWLLIETGFERVEDSSLHQELRKSFLQPNEPLDSLLEESIYTIENNEIFEVGFDNKYTDRFTYDITDIESFPGTRWKLALTFLYTQPYVPIVYYGTEIAVNGEKGPLNSPLMDFRTDKELIDYISQLGVIRKENPSLVSGIFTVLYEKEGLAVYKRELDDEITVTVINNTSMDQSIDVKEADIDKGKELRALMGTDLVRVKDGTYTIYVDRESSEIYRVFPLSGINYFFIAALVVVFVGFFLFMYLAWRRQKNPKNEGKS